MLVEEVVISMSWLMGREEMQKCRKHLKLLGIVAVKSRLQWGEDSVQQLNLP